MLMVVAAGPGHPPDRGAAEHHHVQRGLHLVRACRRERQPRVGQLPQRPACEVIAFASAGNVIAAVPCRVPIVPPLNAPLMCTSSSEALMARMSSGPSVMLVELILMVWKSRARRPGSGTGTPRCPRSASWGTPASGSPTPPCSRRTPAPRSPRATSRPIMHDQHDDEHPQRVPRRRARGTSSYPYVPGHGRLPASMACNWPDSLSVTSTVPPGFRGDLARHLAGRGRKPSRRRGRCPAALAGC